MENQEEHGSQENPDIALSNVPGEAPWGGLIGEKFVNVLEVNLELNQRFRV
jgi:K+-transporting ATPase c subunit